MDMQSMVLVGHRLESLEKAAREMFGTSPVYVIEAEEGKKVGIAEVRRVVARLRGKSGSLRFVWIREGERMTVAAQNALLKTLEEPPDNTVFVLTTTNIYALLKTVVSRCVVKRVGGRWERDEGVLGELKEVMGMGEDERLRYGGRFKDREQAGNWMKRVVESLWGVWQEGVGGNMRVVGEMLEIFLEAMGQLEKNVNVILVMNELLLKLPKLKKSA